MFPLLLFIRDSSTEARCKTLQPGVEFCLGTFNQSLNSTGIWGCMSNIGAISIPPLVATMLSLWRMEKHAADTDLRQGVDRCIPFLPSLHLTHCSAPCNGVLSFMDTGQSGEQSFFILVLHIFNVLFISHQVVSNGVLPHYSNPFCTVTFINMDLVPSWCTEW